MRSIVYDIYSFELETTKDAVKEYGMLIRELKMLAGYMIGNYKIRLDVGAYEFNAKGGLKRTDKPRIHLVVQGKDTLILENALGANIASFPSFHNFEKRVFEGKIFSKYNKKFFNKFTNHYQMMDCKYDRKKQRYTVTSYPIKPFLTQC